MSLESSRQRSMADRRANIDRLVMAHEEMRAVD